MSKKRISDQAGWVSLGKLPRGPGGRVLCRRCGTEVPRGRRTFCSKECVHQHKLRSNPGYVRDCLDARDAGVCCICGLDTMATAKAFWADRPVGSFDKPLPRYLGQRHLLAAVCGNERGHASGAWYRWAERFKNQLGVYPWKRRRQRFWDADHIQPVQHDGGGCGLDNYQTLCLPCHRQKTKEQRADKRAAVKPSQSTSTKEFSMADKPSPSTKQLKKAFAQWMQDPENSPHRLVSKSKLKELTKALDPDVRMNQQVHLAVCKEVGRAVIRAVLRVYDNKRATIRASDI